MTSSVVGLRSSKLFPKSKPAPKKSSQPLFGGLLPVWSTTAFWIQAKLLHLRSVLSKSMWCTKNCNTCSQHCPTEWPNSSQQLLTTCRKINTSKIEWIGLQSFASSTIFTWSLTIQLPLLQASRQLLAEEMLPYQQEAENAFQEFIEIQSTDMYAIGINKLISDWQKCVDCNGSYSDLFEPSYNDLKLMIWSRNYICANLIRIYT